MGIDGLMTLKIATNYNCVIFACAQVVPTAKRPSAKTRETDLVCRLRAITTYWRVMQIKDKIRRRKQTDSERREAELLQREHTGAQASSSQAHVEEGATQEESPSPGLKRTRTVNNYREARTYTSREEAPKRVKRRVQGTAVGIDLLQRLWGLHASDADDRRSTAVVGNARGHHISMTGDTRHPN